MKLDIQNDVRAFMDKAKQPSQYSDWNTEQAELYFKLVKEEYGELKRAFTRGDYVEVADAIGDLVWVTMGLANSMGIHFGSVWNEIKDSNMTKLIDMKFRKDGKIIKGESFRPVDLPSILPYCICKDGEWKTTESLGHG